jgi:hypothetical protein
MKQQSLLVLGGEPGAQTLTVEAHIAGIAVDKIAFPAEVEAEITEPWGRRSKSYGLLVFATLEKDGWTITDKNPLGQRVGNWDWLPRDRVARNRISTELLQIRSWMQETPDPSLTDLDALYKRLETDVGRSFIGDAILKYPNPNGLHTTLVQDLHRPFDHIYQAQVISHLQAGLSAPGAQGEEAWAILIEYLADPETLLGVRYPLTGLAAAAMTQSPVLTPALREKLGDALRTPAGEELAGSGSYDEWREALLEALK